MKLKMSETRRQILVTYCNFFLLGGGYYLWMQTQRFMKISIGVTIFAMLVWGIGRNLY